MASKKKKTLCEEAGHYFQPTTSDTVKVCCRSGCKVMTRLVDGQWVAVVSASSLKKQPQPESEPLITIFDACENTRIHVHPVHAVHPRSLQSFWQEEGVQQ